tara:strand:+ start:7433 stop:8797 length:1365 start_codon:yes stop_codon:yes gene_type:complete
MAALGLGKILGLGILGNIFGGEDKQGLLQNNQQQPTQVANSGQGFNMNNMSPSQWANTAIALNSMRLEPDANLATAMRERIASGDKRMQGIETAQWLEGQGRTDLKEMVLAGILDPQKAIQIAMTKEAIPAWRQKYDFVMKRIEDGKPLTDIENAIFGIPQTQTNATEQKLDLLINPPIDPKTNLPRVWTDDQLHVIGVPKDSIPVFQAKLDKIDALKLSDPEMFTEEEWKSMYKKVLSGDSTDISIDVGLDENSYAKSATQDIYQDHKDIIDGLPKLIQQIQKIYTMQDILDRADEGEIRTGVFEPMQTGLSRFFAGLGLGSGDQASSMQVLQSYMGSDVFPLIKALGIGARGMDTPAERIFLQQSFVGDPTMEVSALKEITQRRLDILLEALDIYNTRASTLTEDGLNSAYFKMYEDTFKVRIMPEVVPIRQTKALIEQEKEDKNATMDKYF